MLKELRIANLILMESLTLSLIDGFNVISGETGSGKSALTEAIGLLMGKRADLSLLRFGAEKAFVEAQFTPPFSKELIYEMENAGIEFDPDEPLFVKRELNSLGKSRCFINHGQVHLNLLKKTIPLLIGMVGQHAVKELFQEDHHRKILDLFADHAPHLETMQEAYKTLHALKEEKKQLTLLKSEREKGLEILQNELEELEEANVKPGEDEILFEEYSRLMNARSLLSSSHRLLEVLQNDKGSILSLLSRYQSDIVKMAHVDSKLEEVAKTWKTSLLELQEAARFLERFSSFLEDDPARAEQINARLVEVNRIKKKYGDSIGVANERKSTLLMEMKKINHESARLLDIEKEIVANELNLNALAKDLSKKRKESASRFAAAMEEELRLLNMSKATFHVDIKEKPLSPTGSDLVEFFLTPNAGEAKIAIKECASGGELSRILFSLNVLLAGKTEIATLIFDEIDGNIGGITAGIVGKKLAEISLRHQVICITHFPQVAKPASHHIQIAKEEKEGRTHTVAKILNAASRKEELARMIGT